MDGVCIPPNDEPRCRNYHTYIDLKEDEFYMNCGHEVKGYQGLQYPKCKLVALQEV